MVLIGRMQIILSPEEAKVLRTIGAKINGSLGGSARTKKKSRTSRTNIKQALKARGIAVATAA